MWNNYRYLNYKFKLCKGLFIKTENVELVVNDLRQNVSLVRGKVAGDVLCL